jgi:hypothetical protein
VSPVASSDDSDDSMGLSATERAYIRSVERAGLGGSDDLEGEDSEEGGNGGEGATTTRRVAAKVAMTTRATVMAVTPVARCHRLK